MDSSVELTESIYTIDDNEHDEQQEGRTTSTWVKCLPTWTLDLYKKRKRGSAYFNSAVNFTFYLLFKTTHCRYSRIQRFYIT
jgi:hypothetical protein